MIVILNIFSYLFLSSLLFLFNYLFRNTLASQNFQEFLLLSKHLRIHFLQYLFLLVIAYYLQITITIKVYTFWLSFLTRMITLWFSLIMSRTNPFFRLLIVLRVFTPRFSRETWLEYYPTNSAGLLFGTKIFKLFFLLVEETSFR